MFNALEEVFSKQYDALLKINFSLKKDNYNQINTEKINAEQKNILLGNKMEHWVHTEIRYFSKWFLL